MKQNFLRILALCLALCLLLSAAIFATEEPAAEEKEPETVPAVTYEYPDDWSREAMVFAVENGILAGDQNHRLNPEKNITRAEMAAVLVRMLAASGSADLSAFKDVSAADWFYAELSAAYAAGIFSGTSASKMAPNAFLTREQAIVVLTRAFGIADTDRTFYTKFSDAKQISSYARDAVSAMAKQGLLSGYADGGVHPQSNITRAEIAQLIYNLFDCIADTPEDIPASGRVLYRGTAALPDPFKLDGSLVIGQPYAGTLSPSGWDISGTLSVRCGSKVTADFSALKAGQLVFAPAGGTLTSGHDTTFIGGSVDFTGSTKTLTVLSGSNTFTGSCDALILHDNAQLVMNGDVDTISLGTNCSLHCNGKANAISIGDGCTVILEKDMDSIEITSNNVHLTLNGRVEKVSAEGRNTVIDGSGSVGELSYFSTTTFTVACDKTVDLWEKEYGRDYAEALSTVKTLKIPCYTQRDTNLYQHSGGYGYITTIPKGTLVYNEYWPEGAFMYVTTSSGQKGWVNRYHLFIDGDNASYDGSLDYSEGTKCGFVNLRGYSSPTGYLIWVSRYTQKVIIYTGYKGNWNILKTYPCASGSVYTPTTEGIYDIYDKTWMWDFHSYMVTNVSLFNGGMAFHSYLLNYDGSDYYNALGRPMSHGCVRMNPADAAFIYNSIPKQTTVIVY